MSTVYEDALDAFYQAVADEKFLREQQEQFEYLYACDPDDVYEDFEDEGEQFELDTQDNDIPF